MAGGGKRRLTNEGNALIETGNKVDVQNLAKDLTELCEKEYKRRFSDNRFKEIVENDKREEESFSNLVKKNQGGDTASNFIKSPKQVLGSSSQNTKNNPASNLADNCLNIEKFNFNATRERGSSAFKKYDPIQKESEDLHKRPGDNRNQTNDGRTRATGQTANRQDSEAYNPKDHQDRHDGDHDDQDSEKKGHGQKRLQSSESKQMESLERKKASGSYDRETPSQQKKVLQMLQQQNANNVSSLQQSLIQSLAASGSNN